MKALEKKIATSVLGFSLCHCPAWGRELTESELMEMSFTHGTQVMAFFRPSTAMETTRDSFSWNSASEMDHIEYHDDRRAREQSNQQQRRSSEMRARQFNMRNNYSNGDSRSYRYRGSSSVNSNAAANSAAAAAATAAAAQARSGHAGR